MFVVPWIVQWELFVFRVRERRSLKGLGRIGGIAGPGLRGTPGDKIGDLPHLTVRKGQPVFQNTVADAPVLVGRKHQGPRHIRHSPRVDLFCPLQR